MQHKCLKTNVHHFTFTFLLLALCLCNSWGWFPNKKQSTCHFACLSLFPPFSLSRRFFFRRSDTVFQICGSIWKKRSPPTFCEKWWRLQVFGSASLYQRFSSNKKFKNNYNALASHCCFS